jgi:hypothetical protein
MTTTIATTMPKTATAALIPQSMTGSKAHASRAKPASDLTDSKHGPLLRKLGVTGKTKRGGKDVVEGRNAWNKKGGSLDSTARAHSIRVPLGGGEDLDPALRDATTANNERHERRKEEENNLATANVRLPLLS